MQTTEAHAEDVPKTRRRRSKWEKATTGESELEWRQLKGKEKEVSRMDRPEDNYAPMPHPTYDPESVDLFEI